MLWGHRKKKKKRRKTAKGVGRAENGIPPSQLHRRWQRESTEQEEADGREGLRGDPYLGPDYVEAGPEEGTREVQKWLREQGKNDSEETQADRELGARRAVHKGNKLHVWNIQV